jgi:hypothetical protein
LVLREIWAVRAMSLFSPLKTPTLRSFCKFEVN